MKLVSVVAVSLLFAAPVMAETYSWEDQSGAVNFTDNYYSIPAKFRKKAKTLGEMSSDAPVAKPAADPGAKAAPAAAKEAAGSAGKSELFGGKTLEQWKQDLESRQAAIKALQARIDNMDAALARPGADKNLTVERNKAAEQHNELINQYNQQTELARKAGITFQ